MNEQYSLKKVITFAGAFIALLIGSGFATGQEIMQYFTAYGGLGFLGILACFILFLVIGTELIETGYEAKFDNPNDIYSAVCGPLLGKFYDYFAVFFLFLSYTVMVAGAQATAIEQYNSPELLGGVILAAAVILTVFFGLDKIVDVIGSIGPVIVVLALGVGTVSVFSNLDQFSQATEKLAAAKATGNMNIASSNFLLAAASYVGFCVIWLSAFLSQMGQQVQSKKEGRLSISLGAFLFCLATAVMTFALYLNIDEVYTSQIPVLLLARKIHPALAVIFSLTIFLGIYTTAVPLLWNVCARFAKEKTAKYRSLTLVLGVIGAIIGLTIDFSSLVNVVYVLNGYVGFIFIVFLTYRFAKRRLKSN